MRRLPHWLALTALALLACARPAAADEATQARIDREVWRPFLAASAGFDAEGFIALHSPDFVRLGLDSEQIHGLAPYAERLRAGFARATERGVERTVGMRFLKRFSADGLAYDTGYFHGRTTLPDGQVRESYVRFEVVLREENGAWRILLDKDSAEGGRITAAMFAAAAPLTPNAP